MTGMDQVVWNLVNDQDLFCIWAIASLDEPLKDNLINNALKYLMQTVPILCTRPVTNWFYGTWQFIEKKNVDDLIVSIHASTDEEARKQLQKTFSNPINARECSMIRVSSIDGPTEHYFVIQVHHLVVDGEGLKRICIRFTEIYRALYREKGWRPAEISDPCRSWWQIGKKFSLAHLFLVVKAYLVDVYGTITSIRQKRTGYQLINDNAADTVVDTQEGIHELPYFESITIENELMTEVKAFAERKHVTVNDILMTSFSLAAMTWNKKLGDERDWLKFFYTANLRRWWGEPEGTFGNFSIVLPHEEIYENLQTPSIALASTKAKVDKVKETIGLHAFFVMLLIKCIPYVLVRRLSLRAKKKLIAFVQQNHAMTNIGIIDEKAGDFGHTKSGSLSLLAPILPGGCIYTISTYKNTATLHLACTEAHLSRESAKNFLALWKEMVLKGAINSAV
ncbi:MAG: condensation domain-containing protein [Candidatus Electrothrix sp. YB6]